MDTDSALIRKMKSGDGSAGDEFVRKYYADILKYCSYHCKNREMAEDLTQETFMKFFARLSVYQSEGKAKNYLYTIARNLCIDAVRESKDWMREDESSLTEVGKADCEIKRTEDQITLEWAFNQLSDDFREVIILFYFQELKIREIANVLKISVPLTKYRLKQSKLKLAEIIGKEAANES